MTTLAEMIAAAEDTPNPDDYIARVKSVVAEEIGILDPTATVEDTRYFNHSAIPDFVVTWPGERARREVFLRHSYASVEAAEDERHLADADAMVMSLRPAEINHDHIRHQRPRASRLLLTDSAAVDVIGARDSSTRRPLTSLVQANFLRGAKGLVDPARAERLLQLDDATGSESANDTQTLIVESFAEDAAARITRTAELINIAVSPDAPIMPTVGGQLSLAELRSLLPWLLKQDAARANTGFWTYIGSLFSFEDLEGIRLDLVGLDLSPLIHANGSMWTAKRAYVGLVPPSEDDDAAQASERVWSFENAALGVSVAGRRLLLAHRGTMLKKRPGGVSADWTRVEPTLADKRIASIELKGIRRSVTLRAEQSPDIRADVQEVTDSLDDSYFVDRVTLRLLAAGDREGTTDVEVRFDEGLVVADGDASLSDLASAALNVLDLGRGLESGSVPELFSQGA